MDTFVVVIAALTAYYFIKTLIVNDLSAEKAGRIKNEGAIVIDVRSEDEYMTSHLKDAVNVPLNEINEKVGGLVPDKDKNILLYCRSGSRSFAGKRIIKRMGYKNVYNLGSFKRAKRLVEKV